ncbi:TPA: 23S rRNA (uracil(1939)-C(5))-methyltransferase RlmD [Candidatus Woesearchaeota archaeon]|nr:23S rRNA (uracil(1939)-C(5))-methyltransferase RlmD [Candidatus Woesearchaeota archaeon]
MEQVTPLCPYFGECGGCTAQHISYTTQVENKKNVVVNALKKNNIEYDKEIQLFTGNEYNYRNRMDFIFSFQGPALRKKDKFNKFVPIKRCEISNEKINSLLKEVSDWFEAEKNYMKDGATSSLDTFDINKFTGCLKYVVIRAPENSDSTTISFVLNSNSLKLAEHTEQIKKFSEICSAKNVVIAKVDRTTDESISRDCFAVKGSTSMEESLNGKKIIYSSQSFFQNNMKMAEKMISYCRDAVKKYADKYTVLVDLYGGSGTFGISLADLFYKCYIIDNDTLNINCAKENIAANKIINTEATCADATSLSINFSDAVVITDPPRSGMNQKAIKKLLQLMPKAIIYISCNPQELAKELKFFKKHYTLESISVFDLFPQTTHIEAVAELRRR